MKCIYVAIGQKASTVAQSVATLEELGAMEYTTRGWLQQRAGRWCLTDPEGMALSNQVLIEVILWWEECCSGSAGPNPSTRR